MSTVKRQAARIGGVLLVLMGAVALWPRPARDAARPASAPAAAAPAAAATASPRSAAAASAARRARDALRAQILEALKRRDAGVVPPPSPALAAPRGAAAPPLPETAEQKGHYDPAYIREVFREDMFPMMRACYESALARSPKLAGRLVLSFAIVADPEVGGVVEDAEFAEDSDLKDAEMETCVRESLMSLTFDKPPSGGGYVTVKYPVLFSPGDDEEDAAAP